MKVTLLTIHKFDDKLQFQVFLLIVFLCVCAADILSDSQPAREGRQDDSAPSVGVDFSGCETDPDTGFCCINTFSRRSL